LKLGTIRKSFDRIADRYDAHAALEQEVCNRLIERTEFRRHDPVRILDLGCATGSGTAALKKRFRKAQVIGLDASEAMLSYTRHRSSLLKPIRPVCADLSALPFSERSADLVFSNLASYWCPEPMAMFSEIRRVMQPDGMFLFSTLGPASLLELRDAWAVVDQRVEVPVFADLLEIGDALMAAGFSAPVMDLEKLTLSYPTLDAMLDELEATGTSMLIRGWDLHASRREELEKAFAPLKVDGKFPLTFELVYGTAFGPKDGQPRKTEEGDVATFSVDALLKTHAGNR
jgi:malonyl-CoA O-methyltransferase